MGRRLEQSGRHMLLLLLMELVVVVWRALPPEPRGAGEGAALRFGTQVRQEERLWNVAGQLGRVVDDARHTPLQRYAHATGPIVSSGCTFNRHTCHLWHGDGLKVSGRRYKVRYGLLGTGLPRGTRGVRLRRYGTSDGER